MAKQTSKTVMFTFSDVSSREKFLMALSKIKQRDVVSAINNYVLDPPIKDDKYRECAVFVSGSKLVEGTYKQMSLRFSQEINTHSAKVELKEKIGDEWTTIRKRATQPQN